MDFKKMNESFKEISDALYKLSKLITDSCKSITKDESVTEEIKTIWGEHVTTQIPKPNLSMISEECDEHNLMLNVCENDDQYNICITCGSYTAVSVTGDKALSSKEQMEAYVYNILCSIPEGRKCREPRVFMR